MKNKVTLFALCVLFTGLLGCVAKQAEQPLSSTEEMQSTETYSEEGQLPTSPYSTESQSATEEMPAETE